MSSSAEDSDAELLEEERRIREQYNLDTENDSDGGTGNTTAVKHTDESADDPKSTSDLAAHAIEEQITKLSIESERLQEERNFMREQVSNFEDLFMAVKPVQGSDLTKWQETVVIDGKEVIQDYRDLKIRDLSKKTRSLTVKVNALTEGNEKYVKELAAAQLKIAELQKKKEKQIQALNLAADAGESTPQEQQKLKLRSKMEENNRKSDMLKLRRDHCARQIDICERLLRNELGLASDEKISAEAILNKGGNNIRRRKQAVEEMSLAQTEVKRIKDKINREKRRQANPNFRSREMSTNVDRQAEQDLEYMNQQRQEALLELREDNEILSEEIAAHKAKIMNSKQRVQALSQERQKHLHQLKRVNEKKDLDVKLVAAFEAESQRIRKQLREGLRSVTKEHADQRKDTAENTANASRVLEAELQRKEDDIFDMQQRLRTMQDEAQRLRQQQQQATTETTARSEIRLIRKLKQTNSELWDIIQDYEKKLTLISEAVESNESQFRDACRKHEDLERRLALSIDDKGRTVTIRLNEEELLLQRLDTLVEEGQVMKNKYRAREQEVDQELSMYQTMCDEIRGQLQSRANSRGDSRDDKTCNEDTAAILEENRRLQVQIDALQGR